MKVTTIYLRHKTGATHSLTGRRCAKLVSELSAGRGGVEVVALVEADYEGFMGPDGSTLDFEELNKHLEEK